MTNWASACFQYRSPLSWSVCDFRHTLKFKFLSFSWLFTDRQANIVYEFYFWTRRELGQLHRAELTGRTLVSVPIFRCRRSDGLKTVTSSGANCRIFSTEIRAPLRIVPLIILCNKKVIPHRKSVCQSCWTGFFICRSCESVDFKCQKALRGVLVGGNLWRKRQVNRFRISNFKFECKPCILYYEN